MVIIFNGQSNERTRGARRTRTVVPVVVVAAALIVLVGVTAWLARPHHPAPPEVTGSLWDADPRARAVACRTAAPVDLVARAGDVDWRVRAAAFEALDRRARLPVAPMRDVPMAQRERTLLEWVRNNIPALRGQLCEVFARSAYLEFGEPLARICLECHAGPEPEPALDAATCAACHAATHAQWRGTAHAQSLSHLQLPTVDPVTREPRHYDFGGRAGLSCAACHRPSGAHPKCVASFETTACRMCHEDVQREWEAWRAGAQPRRADWPPGSIAFDDRDDRGCNDCHMPQGDHRWSARRDATMLRAGIALSLRRAPGGAAEVVLTNLAGHGYPTGSTRRALEIHVTVDGGQERLVATLAPDRLGGSLAPPGPALGPGEARVLPLPGTPRAVRCRLVYRRDRFDAGSYSAQITSAQRVFPAAGTGWEEASDEHATEVQTFDG